MHKLFAICVDKKHDFSGPPKSYTLWFTVISALGSPSSRDLSVPAGLTMVAHSVAAAKRLRKELQVLRKQQQQQASRNRSSTTSSSSTTGSNDDDDDICLEVDPDNLLHWKGWIRGPADTPYERGVFELEIRCGTDYPMAPPSIKFVTKVRDVAAHNESNKCPPPFVVCVAHGATCRVALVAASLGHSLTSFTDFFAIAFVRVRAGHAGACPPVATTAFSLSCL